MFNFKSFRSAGEVLTGVELMQMIYKGKFAIDATDSTPAADQLYAMAEMVRPV